MALSTLDMQVMTRPGLQADDGAYGGMTAREGCTAFALGLYLLGCGAATLYFMIYIWAGSLVLLEAALPGIAFQPDHLKDVQSFVYTTCGAVLGALILSLHGLHKYAVVLGRFRIRFSGSYLLGPWAAGLIGIATYAMLRGGLLVFGTDDGQPGGSSCFAFLALGIMTGFAWERMLARIDDAARQVFGSRKPVAKDATSL